MLPQDSLFLIVVVLSIALTCGLLGLAKMIFDKRRTVFKNIALCQILCNQALILLISGIAIYWYLLYQYIEGSKGLTLNRATLLGLAGCVFSVIAVFWTYKCFKNCWRLVKTIKTKKISAKMKVVACLTIIFIFGTACFLWVVAAMILPNKIMPLFE